MICNEKIIINNRTYIRTWSDSNMYIHGGFPEGNYSEAIDPEDMGRTYIETENSLPGPEDEEISDTEALMIITGEGGGEQ